MSGIHGGDIYRNHVKIDFSVNVNPLGVSEAVKAALHEAVMRCGEYPDPSAEQLKAEVGRMLAVPEGSLLFGNGASELFMAAAHGVRPGKTVIPVPSFYGYEHAATATGGEVLYYETKKEHMFCVQEDFLSVLTEDVDLVFLANPNNPTGSLLSRDYLSMLIEHCRDRGIFVILDECFIEFCGSDHSMLRDLHRFPNLLLIRAFTKIFAIPGVRLGYLLCGDPGVFGKISRQLPEWNVSGFAQAAGCECAKQQGFVEKTVDYVRGERQFLREGLARMGVSVCSGQANFLLIHSERHLYEQLLDRGILIRDCGNFRGLPKGFYRIAVRCREENEILLKAMGEIMGEAGYHERR